MCYFFNKLFRSSRRSLRICLYKIFSTMSLFWPPFMSIAMSERESYSPNTSLFIIVSYSSCLITPPPQKNFLSPFIGEFRGGGYGGVFGEVLHVGREIGGMGSICLSGSGSGGGNVFMVDRVGGFSSYTFKSNGCFSCDKGICFYSFFVSFFCFFDFLTFFLF